MFTSDFLAATTQISQYGVDPALVDGAQTLIGNAQGHPALLAFHPNAVHMEIGKEYALGLVVCVRDVVAYYTPLAGYLADSGHGYTSEYN
jgi:hypothetical protein